MYENKKQKILDQNEMMNTLLKYSPYAAILSPAVLAGNRELHNYFNAPRAWGIGGVNKKLIQDILNKSNGTQYNQYNLLSGTSLEERTLRPSITENHLEKLQKTYDPNMEKVWLFRGSKTPESPVNVKYSLPVVKRYMELLRGDQKGSGYNGFGKWITPDITKAQSYGEYILGAEFTPDEIKKYYKIETPHFRDKNIRNMKNVDDPAVQYVLNERYIGDNEFDKLWQERAKPINYSLDSKFSPTQTKLLRSMLRSRDSRAFINRLNELNPLPSLTRFQIEPWAHRYNMRPEIPLPDDAASQKVLYKNRKLINDIYEKLVPGNQPELSFNDVNMSGKKQNILGKIAPFMPVNMPVSPSSRITLDKKTTNIIKNYLKDVVDKEEINKLVKVYGEKTPYFTKADKVLLKSMAGIVLGEVPYIYDNLTRPNSTPASKAVRLGGNLWSLATSVVPAGSIATTPLMRTLTEFVASDLEGKREEAIDQLPRNLIQSYAGQFMPADFLSKLAEGEYLQTGTTGGDAKMDKTFIDKYNAEARKRFLKMINLPRNK